MKLVKFLSALSFGLLVPMISFAQNQPANPAEEDKQLYEIIQTQVDKMEEILQLEDWQVFYVDSIMVHDYNAMQSEIRELSEKKVNNPDAYNHVQDKWMDVMYYSFQKLLTDEQWEKYLKTGAAKEKKARDKRAGISGK